MGKEKIFKDNIAKDCFAYYKGRCRALTVKQCEGKGCSFYKTRHHQEQDRERTRKRIMSLDKGLQKYIIERYYMGKNKFFELEE
ncbi:hypothetical protein [Clostridium prolinivorans]|uniref:hypothetical protein n=1 Tax=Clostridium prolinivorans TaxID=2769420 RepID=UPI00196B8A12|nr:hypothetical protein [Clostridium prolinivorans]